MWFQIHRLFLILLKMLKKIPSEKGMKEAKGVEMFRDENLGKLLKRQEEKEMQ